MFCWCLLVLINVALRTPMSPCICCCSDIWTRLALWQCPGAAAAREAGIEPSVQHSHAARGPYDRVHPPDQLQPKGCPRDAACHCSPAGSLLTCACPYAQRNNIFSVCKCASKEPGTLTLVVASSTATCKCLHPPAVACCSTSKALSQD